VPEWNNGQDDVLRLKNLKGAMVVLVTGSVLACITAIWEFMKGSKENGKATKGKKLQDFNRKNYLARNKQKRFLRARFWIRFWTR